MFPLGFLEAHKFFSECNISKCLVNGEAIIKKLLLLFYCNSQEEAKNGVVLAASSWPSTKFIKDNINEE